MSAANHHARLERRSKHARKASVWVVALCPICLVERPAHVNGVVLAHPVSRDPFRWCGGDTTCLKGVGKGIQPRSVTLAEWQEAVRR